MDNSAIANSAAVHMGVQISLQDPTLILLAIYPEVEFLDHTAILFNFLRVHHTIFHSGYTISQSDQQCTRFPISPHFYQYL